MDGSGVSYQLFATAKYVDVGNHKRDTSPHHRTSSSSSSPTSWSLSGIYSAICSGQRTATAEHNVAIKRFFGLPSEDTPGPVSPITYLLNSNKITTSRNTDKLQIPSEILSKICILASVPEYLNVEDNRATLTLRLRTKDLKAEECQRLQLVGFRVDIIQKDKCRSVLGADRVMCVFRGAHYVLRRSQPSKEYKSRYPLPAEELQPPNLPLRWTQRSPLSMDYYSQSGKPTGSCSRTFSLLPPSEDGQYLLQNENYIFANDATQTDIPTWYTLQTNIPVMHKVHGNDDDDSIEWAGNRILRPTNLSGPLLTVRHEIIATLFMSYDCPDSTQRAHQSLTFSVPVKFASPAPRISHDRRRVKSSLSLASSSSTPSSSPFSSRPTTPVDADEVSTAQCDSQPKTHDALDDHSDSDFSPILPPYSQFYYSNGDRKIDPTPLPLYTPREAPNEAIVESVGLPEDEDRHSIAVVQDIPLFSQKACTIA